jgi:dolichyl-phosphate-mannose-protein mannosyltransferase
MLRPREKLFNSSRAFAKAQQARRSTTTWQIAIRGRFKNLQLAVGGDDLALHFPRWRTRRHGSRQALHGDIWRRLPIERGASWPGVMTVRFCSNINLKGSHELVVFLTLMIGLPVLFAAGFFPVPAEDLREQINWGSVFPLVTSKHPPLQSWLAGLVALTSTRDAWPYILVAQCLNAVGLVYAAKIAGEFIDQRLAWPVAVAFCISIPVSAEVVIVALNADQIQGPFWLGTLYHLLRASQDDRWVDWLACAAYAALSLLAKYFSLLFLMALAAAFLTCNPALIRRPKAYVAALLSVGMVAVHLVPMLSDPAPIRYGLRIFDLAASLPKRALSLLKFVASIILYGLPFLLALAFLWRRGDIQPEPSQQCGPQRAIVLTTAILAAVITGMIVVGGAGYYIRMSKPLLPLFLLSIFCAIRFDPKAMQEFVRTSLVIWLVGVVVVLLYALTFTCGTLREPAEEAAALIRADWERHYHCGPAYIVGEQLSAHAIGLYYGGSVIGLSLRDYWLEPWVDRDRIAKHGFILVGNPERRSITTMPDVTPLDGHVSTVESQYRHTLRNDRHVYQYHFVAPKAC